MPGQGHAQRQPPALGPGAAEQTDRERVGHELLLLERCRPRLPCGVAPALGRAGEERGGGAGAGEAGRRGRGTSRPPRAPGPTTAAGPNHALVTTAPGLTRAPVSSSTGPASTAAGSTSAPGATSTGPGPTPRQARPRGQGGKPAAAEQAGRDVEAGQGAGVGQRAPERPSSQLTPVQQRPQDPADQGRRSRLQAGQQLRPGPRRPRPSPRGPAGSRTSRSPARRSPKAGGRRDQAGGHRGAAAIQEGGQGRPGRRGRRRGRRR